MKTVEILIGHTGYPNDKKRHFAKGEVVDLADAYADLIIGKSLAREQAAVPATPKAATAKTKD